MKSKSLITRVLFSICAIALFGDCHGGSNHAR